MSREANSTLYKKEMYKAYMQTEKMDDQPTLHDVLYKMKYDVSGAGDKENKILNLGNLTRAETETEDYTYRSPNSGPEVLVNYHRFYDGLQLSYEEVQDSVKVTNLLQKYASTWAESVKNEKEEFGARPFNEGGNLAGDWIFDGTHVGNTDSSGDLLFDSKPLFNLTGNTRTSSGGATYYNSVAGLTLSSTNLQTLYTLMTSTNNRSEIDRIKRNRPDTLLTQVGDDEFTAWQILNTVGQKQSEVGTSNNEANPWQQGGPNFVGKLQHFGWDYLDDTSTPFYLLKRNTDAMEFHVRQLPVIDYFQDPTNKSYKADITMRMGIKISEWRQIVRGGGTSA